MVQEKLISLQGAFRHAHHVFLFVCVNLSSWCQFKYSNYCIDLLTHWVWTKWLTCCRRHFQRHFSQTRFCILIPVSLKVCPHGHLAINQHWFRKWQAITSTKFDKVLRRDMVSLHHNESTLEVSRDLSRSLQPFWIMQLKHWNHIPN